MPSVGAVGVTIVAAIGAIWAIGLLSLFFTLPHDFVSPTERSGDVVEE